MISPLPREMVTRILLDDSTGDREAAQRLMPVVYDELRGIARQYLQRERRDHTLQATALVHEAYLRLVDQAETTWHDRARFFAVAAGIMRRILVDHARSHRAAKRGGGREKIQLDEELAPSPERDVDLVALDDALKDLGRFDSRQSQIVELRFFGGLTVEEVAEVLEISPRTVKREWRLARAWLRREIARGEDNAGNGHTLAAGKRNL